MERRLIVTHQAPDLDAIFSCWLLKRFDAQNHGDAKFAFVPAGDKLLAAQIEQMGFRPSSVTHVDTGLGRFDHHDEVKGQQYTCAAQLVYQYLVQIHPDLSEDKALPPMIDFVLEIDHFRDVDWPGADSSRYMFMLPEIIQGMDFSQNHDDQHQVVFGMEALEYVYASMTHFVKAEEVIEEKGVPFLLKDGTKALALETRNDECVRLAQKKGYQLAVRKDPEKGSVRIKCRPDNAINLRSVYERIIELDEVGTWFYHPSGKMVLNGSTKNPNHIPSPLSLEEIVKIIKEELG